MDWLYNMCSCITPNVRYSIINYLNSNTQNNQVIQQQKCTQQQREVQHQPSANIYSYAKTKSYNFMKIQNNQQNYKQQGNNIHDDSQQQQQQQQQQNNVINVFWYPKHKPTNKSTKFIQYKQILTHKLKIFNLILQQQPSAANYDKIYDSQDDINLLIYCKIQSLLKGKKINSYRFSFHVQGIELKEYEEWLGGMEEKNIIPLLEVSKCIEVDDEDKALSLYHRYFNKLLVINPHDLLTIQKTIKNQQQQNSYTTVIFSVQDSDNKQQKQDNKYNRGWLHLGGLQVMEGKNGLDVHGYLTIQLNVSVSPNMLKQPIAKQIRVFVQKFICDLKKSDQI